MPWASGWYRTANQKPPRIRKKERKAVLQMEVYRRKWAKWKAREPARWRVIAHLRWKRERPKEPWEG